MNIKRSRTAHYPGAVWMVVCLFMGVAITGCQTPPPGPKQCSVPPKVLGCDNEPGPPQRTWIITVGTAGENVSSVNPYQRRVCPGDIVKWKAVPPKDFIRWDVGNSPFKTTPQCYASSGAELKCDVLDNDDVDDTCYEYNIIGKKGNKPLDPHIIVE